MSEAQKQSVTTQHGFVVTAVRSTNDGGEKMLALVDANATNLALIMAVLQRTFPTATISATYDRPMNHPSR